MIEIKTTSIRPKLVILNQLIRSIIKYYCYQAKVRLNPFKPNLYEQKPMAS